MSTEAISIPVEHHPFPPFLPANAKIFFLGTFPPKSNRWSMDFFYPNIINDFWRIIGIIFFHNKDAFWDAAMRKFKEDEIKAFLSEKGIAMGDTATSVRRLKDNASDKFLEIVTPVDLQAILPEIPECKYIVTTGEKASEVMAEILGCDAPKMGEYKETVYNVKGVERDIVFARMPSTSRAYPLSIIKKAEYYARLFESAGLV